MLPLLWGCLLRVGMSVPAHPRGPGGLLAWLENGGWLKPPTPEEGFGR